VEELVGISARKRKYDQPPHQVVVQLLTHLGHFRDSKHGTPPGSSDHGILQARILEWVHFLLQGLLPNQGSNQHLLLLGEFFTL